MRPADRCPGVLRPHRAEDGLVVRLRIPGGQTTTGVLVALGEWAAEFSQPPDDTAYVQLTSRGNLQLRGINDSRLAELTAAIFALGLLPSFAHDRVRNIVASPLTGLAPQRPDLRSMVRELDAALCADPDLVALPGRFLFALDDGRGDVSSLAFDLGYVATGEEAGLLVLGGADPRTRPVRQADAVSAMITLAREFLRLRQLEAGQLWRGWEVPGLGPELTEAWRPQAPTALALGAVDGAASVGVPLGLLTTDQAAGLDSIAAGPVVVTPWRGLVIPGAAESLGALARLGLTVDDSSGWSMITACIGSPGCAKSMIDTRQAASALVNRGRPARPVHISGCERRCGTPPGAHQDLLAPSRAELLAVGGLVR